MYNENKADGEPIKTFVPEVDSISIKWIYWQTIIDMHQCFDCFLRHGKIYRTEEGPELHINCRCYTKPVEAIKAGKASIYNEAGADFHLYHYGILPPNYVTKEYAEGMGWLYNKGNLWDVLPNKHLGGDIYKNRDEKLPSSLGRIWYEADLNYIGGFRNKARVLYTNDGLVFVTYDHYKTFYEIIA